MGKEWGVGTTVWLKIGGPAMTILNYDEAYCLCGWMDHNNEFRTYNFPSGVLTDEIEEE